MDSSVPTGVVLPATFDDTLGAFVIGAYVTTLLYGISVLQMYIFFRRSQDASCPIQLSIWAIMIINTAHLIFTIHAVYFYTVTNFTNALVLLGPIPWSLTVTVLLHSLACVLVQCFFIFRVWKLSGGSRPPTIVLTCGSLALFGTNMTATTELFRLQGHLQMQRHYASMKTTNLTIAAGSFEMATDLLIAVTLCFYLRCMRSQALIRSHSVFNWLMVYTINTGLMTTVVCMLALITSLTFPNTFVSLGLILPLCGLYTNALLGSLNARDWFRSKENVSTINPTSSLRFAGVSTSGPPISLPTCDIDVEEGGGVHFDTKGGYRAGEDGDRVILTSPNAAYIREGQEVLKMLDEPDE